MDGRREQILFVATLVLAGVLTWLDLGEGYRPARAPSPKATEADAIALPAKVDLGALPAPPPGQREESVFAPPRELLPLDPLELPDPPLPPLSVRRPAVQPALQGPHARAYRMSASDLGALALADELQAAPEAEDLGAGDEPVPDEGAAFTGADTAAGAGDEEPVVAAEMRYDWVVRTDGRNRIYGTILNDDPIDLAARPGEDLRFQQVSARTGGPLGAPFTIPRDEVLEHGLARTLENTYRQRSRQLGGGPGAAAARRTLALEMLAAAADDPRALDLAVEEAQLAYAASPGDPAVARLLAAVLGRAFDVEGQLAVYQQALADGSADPAIVAGYAKLVRGLGLTERAWELVEIGRTLGRETAELSVIEARLLADAGRWQEALEILRDAENLPFVGPLEVDQKRGLLLAIGEALIALGQPGGALREAGRVLLDEPTHADALVLQGAAHAAANDLEAAAGSLGAAMASAPNSSRAMTNAGIVAWRQGDGDTARRHLEQARDVDPFRAVSPTLALGFLYEDAGRLEVARDTYAEALLLQPGHPEALYRLGRNQRRDGDPEEAVSTLREALRLAGPEVLLLLELGRASMDRGRFENALRYFREAERLEPDNAEVQWSLGLASVFAGDTLSARLPLEAAVAGGLGGAHVALGVASYRRGDAQEALDHFDEVAKAYAGREEDPQAVYAAAQVARIRDNLSKRQWLDRFGRSSLQRGWEEHMWDGSAHVALDPGGVRVQGRMERPREDERPGIGRAVDGRGFFGVQAEVVAEEPDTRVGLSLTYSQVKGAQGRMPKARLEIWVDTDGQVRLSALDNFDTQVLDGEAVAGAVVAQGETALLGIARLDDVAGRFEFSLDGRRVGEPVELKSLRSFKNPFEMLVWAEAAPGRNVGAVIPLVRIVQAP
ncbi:MAG: tetratricopeptide repeat protein [Planctomycetota bacterium]